mmetsp:Transcript_38456/g.99560  ORF Transcript_38456/g.99560 Transcript_38456/m.99560 type:complete len:207 (+) Transcript_38456:515-1135(+)
MQAAGSGWCRCSWSGRSRPDLLRVLGLCDADHPERRGARIVAGQRGVSSQGDTWKCRLVRHLRDGSARYSGGPRVRQKIRRASGIHCLGGLSCGRLLLDDTFSGRHREVEAADGPALRRPRLRRRLPDGHPGGRRAGPLPRRWHHRGEGGPGPRRSLLRLRGRGSAAPENLRSFAAGGRRATPSMTAIGAGTLQRPGPATAPRTSV